MKTILRILALPLFAVCALAQDQTETALVGQKLTLKATAEGVVTAWLWYKDGLPIQGATNDTLVFASVMAGDAGAYTVTAANSGGAATSDKYILTVATPPPPPPPPPSKPVIKSTLSLVTVEKQSSVRFEVIAENADSLQWLKNGLPLVGQTSTVLAYSKVNPSYTGRYSVSAYNAGGKTTADIVELRVR